MDAKLLEIIVCPESKEKLELASESLLEELNEKILAGELKNRGKQPLKDTLEGALVRVDGQLAYPVRGGIPVLLKEEALEL